MNDMLGPPTSDDLTKAADILLTSCGDDGCQRVAQFLLMLAPQIEMFNGMMPSQSE